MKKACEVCSFSISTHSHHLRPKELGGADEISNRIILCPNCHATAHKLIRDMLALESPALYKLFEREYLTNAILRGTKIHPFSLVRQAMQRFLRLSILKVKLK